MKRQTRYTTEKQITDRIDELLVEASDLLKQAVEHDSQADQCRDKIVKLGEVKRLTQKEQNAVGLEINKLSRDIQTHREQAIKLSKRRNTIQDASLPRLKRALAEFNTRLLPITNDPGVVLK